MQEQPVRKYYDAWIDGYGSASEPQQPGKILRWAKASEQLPAKSGHYYVHTSLDDRIGCFFHLDSGKWEGDLRGEPGNPEIVLEWIEETEDLSAPASPVEERAGEFQRWQSIDINAAIQQVTAVMREADDQFEKTGGGTRHYVSELLIPMLAEKGLVICKTQPFPPSPVIEIGEQKDPNF